MRTGSPAKARWAGDLKSKLDKPFLIVDDIHTFVDFGGSSKISVGIQHEITACFEKGWDGRLDEGIRRQLSTDAWCDGQRQMMLPIVSMITHAYAALANLYPPCLGSKLLLIVLKKRNSNCQCCFLLPFHSPSSNSMRSCHNAISLFHVSR